MKKSVKLICLFFVFLFTISCCYPAKRIAYYTNKKNYITTKGTITSITFNDNNDMLFLSVDNMNQRYSDNYFKIIPENLTIAKCNGIESKIHIGDTIVFISAQRYFGDGYIMPILALSIDKDTFLTFEEGYSNYIKWLIRHPYG